MVVIWIEVIICYNKISLNNIIIYPLKCYNRQIAALVCPSTLGVAKIEGKLKSNLKKKSRLQLRNNSRWKKNKRVC